MSCISRMMSIARSRGDSRSIACLIADCRSDKAASCSTGLPPAGSELPTSSADTSRWIARRRNRSMHSRCTVRSSQLRLASSATSDRRAHKRISPSWATSRPSSWSPSSQVAYEQTRSPCSRNARPKPSRFMTSHKTDKGPRSCICKQKKPHQPVPPVQARPRAGNAMLRPPRLFRQPAYSRASRVFAFGGITFQDG